MTAAEHAPDYWDNPPELESTVPPNSDPVEGHRSVTLTSAATIKVRPVHWLWEERLPLGSLSLLAGREGIGKSTLAYTVAADLTRGRLPGVYARTPKAVIVAATEDSWEHTIVPRLMGADADLARIYRVDVTRSDGTETALSLPSDLNALARNVIDVDAGLILLDPLMSRLSSTLDTHKDADVRLALEPLTAVANRTGAAMLGLIHLNKSHGGDPLSMLMGSRAFAAVARAVLFAMEEPDDEGLILLGQPKNNLGRTDLPTLTFRIAGEKVADTDEGAVWTGKIAWQGESERSIRDALADVAAEGSTTRTAGDEAAAWLTDYLEQNGGVAPSKEVKDAGRREGHAEATLKRASKRLRLAVTIEGYPRRSYWALPGTQPTPVGSTPGESDPTDLIDPTDPTGQSIGSIGSVGSIGSDPPRDEPTERDHPTLLEVAP